MKHFTLGYRDISAPNHWRRIEPGTDFFDSAIILNFGGNQNIQEEQANGYAKNIESILPNHIRSKIKICSVAYNQELVDSSLSRIMITKDATAACDRFYKDYILPLLYVDKYQKQIKSRKGIEKTLQSITIIAHCGGCMVADRVLSNLSDTLQENDIVKSQKELDNLMKKIQLVGYAPYQKIDQNINSLYIAPPDDFESTFATILRGMEYEKDVEYPPKFIATYRRNINSAMPRDIVREFIDKFNEPITVRKGSSVLMIPPKFTHSFECISSAPRSKKESIRHSGEKIAHVIHLFAQNSIAAFANRPYGIDKNAVYDIISGSEAGDSGASI